MAFLVCLVPVCPVRSQPSHKSEQISQLLFGEMCQLLEKTEDFVRIICLHDNYEGWCQSAQLEETGVASPPANNRLAGEWVNKITVDNQDMHIPFGSSLAILDEVKGYSKKYNIAYKGSFIDVVRNANNTGLVSKYASALLNTSYLWGGRSVFGIDCSGFTQLVFKCIHIPLLRDAYQQATQGKRVESLDETKCGDLAFFENEEGKITHVGILLDSKTLIHASGKVRTDTIDNLGIINSETGKRTHHLKIIKRVIDESVAD